MLATQMPDIRACGSLCHTDAEKFDNRCLKRYCFLRCMKAAISASFIMSAAFRFQPLPGLSRGRNFGAQFRGAISARSNFGLGFALTHILTKSDESHRRKSISPKIHLAVNIIYTSRLGIDIELIILNYLGYDSDRYLSFFAFYAFSVLIRGLPALIVCLASAVDAGRFLKSSNDGNPRIKGIEEEENRQRLLRINVIIILPQLSPYRPGIAPRGVLDINLTPLLFLDIVGLVFPFLEAYSVFLVLSLTARA